MIQFSGYGFLIVLVDYVGGILLLSKLSSMTNFLQNEMQQYIGIVVFHVVITIFNFLLAKYLNRKNVHHKVFELKLETFVIVIGIILLLPILMMGKGIAY